MGLANHQYTLRRSCPLVTRGTPGALALAPAPGGEQRQGSSAEPARPGYHEPVAEGVEWTATNNGELRVTAGHPYGRSAAFAAARARARGRSTAPRSTSRDRRRTP